MISIAWILAYVLGLAFFAIAMVGGICGAAFVAEMLDEKRNLRNALAVEEARDVLPTPTSSGAGGQETPTACPALNSPDPR